MTDGDRKGKGDIMLPDNYVGYCPECGAMMDVIHAPVTATERALFAHKGSNTETTMSKANSVPAKWEEIECEIVRAIERYIRKCGYGMSDDVYDEIIYALDEVRGRYGVLREEPDE